MENKSKKILGLDLGTNSVGGALITLNEFGKDGHIEWMGSRIIPLDGDSMSKFESGGQLQTKAANRRILRGSRRLKQRYKLRRARLIRVFKLLGWLTGEFPLDFKKAQNTEGYKFNINNYLPLSPETRMEAVEAFGTDKISEDWLVYFLRKKALEHEITLTELARILYMMNQRRGFKSSRKEVKIEEDDEDEKWPKIEKWVEIKFKTPDTTDWQKQKKALNNDLQSYIERGLCKTIGEYFLIHLIDDRNYRIRQRIVEREYYREELTAIWESQKKYHPILSDTLVLKDIAKTLYHHNEEKQKEICSNNLLYVFANDIIYYQRGLKSQKHSVDVCRFESKEYIQDSEKISVGVKVAPKSCPEFQEFRIWHDIHNIRIFQKEGMINGKQQINIDLTDLYIDNVVKANIFDLFDKSFEVKESVLLKYIHKTLSDEDYKINLYANRDKLKGNETKAVFRKVFKKHGFKEGEQLLQNANVFERLWHILYSLNEEKDLKSAFKRLKWDNGEKINMPDEVTTHLSKLPELPKQYAAYSTKAIKKLLPLMRCGQFWDIRNFNQQTLTRINKIIDGEYDENIDENTREQLQRSNLDAVEKFTGLPVWLATYVVYGKHSERLSEEKYTSYTQIEVNKLIRPNSLRNPFVEQVIRETIQLVKDVCKEFGQPNEIHIELARELKKTAEEKKEISKANFTNYAEKERIKKLLLAYKEGNPQSQSDIEKFRLWKANGGYESNRRFDELFNKKNEFVSQTEIEIYRLWADQNHLSPYTGKPIPLSLLFNKAAYEIEHIFPKSRFFDDSFANKVICETSVNKEKDNRIARLFIQEFGGRAITHGGSSYTILDEDTYVLHCKKIFRGKKLRNLLADAIPEDFVERQLNDTRYITKKIAELLYPVALDKDGIIFCGGSITSELKDRWGLNAVWKDILKPRFERLSEITGEPLIITDSADTHKYHFAKDYKRVDHRHHALDALIIAATSREHIRYLNTLNAVSDENRNKVKNTLVGKGVRDFVKPWPKFTQEAKHGINAIIVSHKATNRVVTKPFNKYLRWVETNGEFKKEFKKQEPPTQFGKSWKAIRRSMFKEPQGVIFLKEVNERKLLDAIKIQIIKEKVPNKKGSKPIDYIYDQAIRPMVKELIKQFNSDIVALEAHLSKNPLKDHKGELIEKVAVAEFKEYAAKRVNLDNTFDEKKIGKIPYANHRPANGKKLTLPQILYKHLEEMGKPELAFAGEGLEVLHKKLGYPLKKVTIFEAKDPESKFKGKYYETDKGGNVYFIIVLNAKGERVRMYTLPLLEAIERITNKLPLADMQEGEKYFTLSPNELVYVPEEGENPNSIDWRDGANISHNIYKMVSCTGGQCYFIPHNVANLLLPYDDKLKKGEFGSQNKSENTMDGVSIKKVCIKLKIDRLGNIQPA